MAISTYKVFLMKKSSGSSYEKLADIKSYGDLGGTPEMLDTTTLSDKSRTFINGIQEQESMEFVMNYTAADYAKLEALKDTETDFAVWFGGTESDGVATPDGSQGKFEFKGYLSVYVNGGGVNEVVEMTATIAPSSTIKFTQS